MTLFIKNLTNTQVKIHSLKLGLQKNETRKLVASFDVEYSDAKNELDILVDDKFIEIIDSLGHNLSTSEIFTDSVQQNKKMVNEETYQTSELKEERFYYVEDVFCVNKGGTVTKSFKGYADTFRIAVKNKSVKYRIKSRGIVMPWQYLKIDKENILSFEYRLQDPEIEILSDSGDTTVNIYIDGYVTNVAPSFLQNFIDTWYENQTACKNNEWESNSDWWDANKISEDGAWNSWDWTSKVGSFITKTINDYDLSLGTKIVQQAEGAKLVIPQNYQTLAGIDHEDFRVFGNEQGIYTVELIGFNDYDAWDVDKFNVVVQNVRYIEFADQMFDITTMDLELWDERWTDNTYYGHTGLRFISENAGFKSALGSYTVDLNGKPKISTLLIDDQNLLDPNTPITSLSAGEYDFFIIANGADAVTMSSVITFDNNGSFPQLMVDGVNVDYPVYFSDPALNYDKKDHFIYKPDGNGGTNIYVEDLPGLGDADFNDIVLNVNFEMTDKIIVHTPEKITDTLVCDGTEAFTAIATNTNGINVYAMGRIGEGSHNSEHDDCQVWKFRNGSDLEIQAKIFHYTSKKTEYFTIPAKTDMYKITGYESDIKMYWYEDYKGSKKQYYIKKHHTQNMFKDDINLKNEVVRTVTQTNSTTYNASGE